MHDTRLPHPRLPLRKYRLLRALRMAKDCRGVTAVEFALIAPVLLLLISGTIEMGIIYFVQSTMEAATSVTSRLGKTGYVDTDNGLTQLQTVQNMLYGTTGGLLDPHNITMTTTAYGNLTQIGQNDQGTGGLGISGQVVVYTISYPWPVVTPVLASLIGTNGTYTVTTRTVVKNEPY